MSRALTPEIIAAQSAWLVDQLAKSKQARNPRWAAQHAMDQVDGRSLRAAAKAIGVERRDAFGGRISLANLARADIEDAVLAMVAPLVPVAR